MPWLVKPVPLPVVITYSGHALEGVWLSPSLICHPTFNSRTLITKAGSGDISLMNDSEDALLATSSHAAVHLCTNPSIPPTYLGQIINNLAGVLLNKNNMPPCTPRLPIYELFPALFPAIRGLVTHPHFQWGQILKASESLQCMQPCEERLELVGLDTANSLTVYYRGMCHGLGLALGNGH